MTTSLQTDPRRATRDPLRKPPRPPLEMPVLFQLADLSLSQVKSSPPSSPAPAPLPQAIAPSTAISEPVATLEPPKKEIPRIEVPSAEASPEEAAQAGPRQLPVTSSTVAAETRTAPSVTAANRLEVPVVEKSAESAAGIATAAATSATEITPPTELTAPSPRERAEQRAKNRQPIPVSNDWMRTHGKFIAVGFIIALIATIYLAQNGDEPPPANPDSAASAKSEGEAKVPSPASEADAKITDAFTAKESVPAQEHGHSPALLKEANPAEGHSPAAAHAELHSPSSAAVKEPGESSEVAESKSLFPWKEPGETRVASKPDEGSSKVQLNPHATKHQAETEAEAPPSEAAAESPSVYGPPGSQPQEPAAEQPAQGEPQLNAPTNYPPTTPGSLGDLQSPQNRPTTTQPRASSPRATPASYEPGTPNNVPPTRTSGPRYERTGSGLY